MPTKNVNWSITAEVTGAGTITAAADAMLVEAIDHIFITIKHGIQTIDQLAEIQPSDATNIRLLVIKSSLYSKELSFKVSGDGGVTKSDKIVLDAPQVFTSGNIALFKQEPKSLYFSYKPSAAPIGGLATTTPDLDIEIFVARTAAHS